MQHLQYTVIQTLESINFQIFRASDICPFLEWVMSPIEYKIRTSSAPSVFSTWMSLNQVEPSAIYLRPSPMPQTEPFSWLR